MKIKFITLCVVLLFIITTYTGTISAGFLKEKKQEDLLSSLSTPKVRGVILRSYVKGNATGGKQVGRVALIDFAIVEFKTIRFFPPGFGYVNYENVSVLMIGLKSKISDGSFYLDTKAEKNKVSSIIFK
jgi:hypothetical protein